MQCWLPLPWSSRRLPASVAALAAAVLLVRQPQFQPLLRDAWEWRTVRAVFLFPFPFGLGMDLTLTERSLLPCLGPGNLEKNHTQEPNHLTTEWPGVGPSSAALEPQKGRKPDPRKCLQPGSAWGSDPKPAECRTLRPSPSLPFGPHFTEGGAMWL